MKRALHRYGSKRILDSAAIVALCLLMGGCFSLNPRSLREMEAALIESNPAMEFESTMKFGVGALTMDVVDLVFVREKYIDVSKITRADIGIYELKQALAYEDFTMPLGNSGECPQREVIIRIHEDLEHTEIAVCIRNEEITGYAVFVISETELVVVNCRGNFDDMVGTLVRGSVNRKES